MPESDRTFQFVADRGDARLRLDRILVRRVTGVSRLSRNVAQRWIESDAVTVDGRPVRRAAVRVAEGASIEVRIPDSAVLRTRPAAEPLPLAIVYEDDEFLVVNKPAGLVVHPSYKQGSGTLLNGVLARLHHRPAARPGIVTRLDKDTSGLVLVALTPAVHARFQRSGVAVSKEYLAIVRGVPAPAAGLIERPIGRDPSDRRRMIVTPDGAASTTRYQVASVHDSPSGPIALVRCDLLTGRTHQIRVHMAACGWPIVGDRVYGTPDAPAPRQALHASRLTFAHPRTGEPIAVEAALPDDMRSLIASTSI